MPSSSRSLGCAGLLVACLVAGSAWAGPPPPPPPSSSVEGSGVAPPDPLVIDQRTPDSDLTGTWSFTRRSSGGPNYVRAPAQDPFFAINPIGFYQGVSMASANRPPYAPSEVGGESSVLTWTGFERGEQSSRVFFQLSAVVEPEVSVEGMRVFVTLPRTSITVRNNLRPLVTRYFDTPVTEVRLRRDGSSVIAVLELRREVAPSWSLQPGNEGYRVLVLEFPDQPPTPAASETETDAPPASETDEDESTESPTPFLPT